MTCMGKFTRPGSSQCATILEHTAVANPQFRQGNKADKPCTVHPDCSDMSKLTLQTAPLVPSMHHQSRLCTTSPVYAPPVPSHITSPVLHHQSRLAPPVPSHITSPVSHHQSRLAPPVPSHITSPVLHHQSRLAPFTFHILESTFLPPLFRHSHCNS